MPDRRSPRRRQAPGRGAEGWAFSANKENEVCATVNFSRRSASAAGCHFWAALDEGVFTMPWSASMIYWPPLVPMGQWPEITCVENANGYDGRKLEKKAPMPIAIADKPDF
jgi:hypothetical protein